MEFFKKMAANTKGFSCVWSHTEEYRLSYYEITLRGSRISVCIREDNKGATLESVSSNNCSLSRMSVGYIAVETLHKSGYFKTLKKEGTQNTVVVEYT